jgi:hypothetical protein
MKKIYMNSDNVVIVSEKEVEEILVSEIELYNADRKLINISTIQYKKLADVADSFYTIGQNEIPSFNNDGIEGETYCNVYFLGTLDRTRT